ncbi:MAG: DUF2849 domain-containing protein [Alphaproteobacteria bacterium]|nr:MAG: DUF2849 domain-containing protein [Alphaproteobacteria bacterium]
MSVVNSLRPGPGQIVTANEIMSGRAVWLTADGSWSDDPRAAAFAESAEDAAALLARAQADNAASRVELVALVAAERDTDGRPWPVRNREIIRALGPTVRPDLGKEAAAG